MTFLKNKEAVSAISFVGRFWTWLKAIFFQAFAVSFLFASLNFLSACGVGSYSVSGGSSSSSDGGVTDQKQMRVMDSSRTLPGATPIALNVGQSITFRSGVFTGSGVYIEDKPAYWTIKSLAGNITSGLPCVAQAVAECTFTPTAVGTVMLEATIAAPESGVIGVASSPVVIVSSLATASSMEIVSGNNQSVVVNSASPLPLSVRVKDSFGQPIPGVGVNFSVTAGGGSLNPPAVTTDSNGLASTTFTVGTIAGVLNQTVVAQVTSTPAILATLNASATAGAPHHLLFTTQPLGDYSILPLSQQPVVTLKDQYENTVPSSANVTLSVSTGTGTLGGGAITLAFNNGVANFSGLTYSVAESGIVLQASSTPSGATLTVNSNAFVVATSGGVVDRLPNDVVFDPAYVFLGGAAGRTTSNSVSINSIDVPIDITVSGPGNPQLKLNGGAAQASLTGVTAGASIQVVADAPTATGNKNQVTISIGDRSEIWEIAYADSAKVSPVFVTSGTWNGALGGLSGADSKCQTAASAAGYGGSWVALLSTSVTSAKSRLPWNWGQMRLLNGTVIANGISDFWDGSWLAPINLTENLITSNSNVWHGTTASGSSSTFQCLNGDWNSSSGSGHVNPASNSSLTEVAIACSNSAALYCVGDPSGAADTTPIDVSFLSEVSYVSGTRMSSNVITVAGVTASISVSVTGAAGNPKIMINGGAEVSSGTVSLGDTIQLVMDAPTTTGTKNTATLTYGSLVKTWWVGYADSGITARVFVSSTTKRADQLGGTSGADNICQNLAVAAGYTGSWKAMLADSSIGGPRNRINFNWGALKRIDGVVVANSWSDLWDGSLQAPININESGATSGAAVVTTGGTSDGSIYLSGGLTTCSDWTGATGTCRVGSVGSATTWMSSTAIVCNDNGGAGYPIYCIENDFVADTTPTSLYFATKVSYTAGVPGRTLSDIVTIKGINSSVSVSVTASAGNPTIKINGGAEVASGTANWGDTIQVVMDAPNSLGTKNIATVTVGSSSFTWALGYADISATAKVFVTSVSYTVANIAGVGGANSKCQTLAASAGLPGTWTALISSVNYNIRDNAPFNWGTLKRVDGQTVATSWDDLWDGTIVNAISIDENSTSKVVQVWTGSTSSGAVDSTNHCNDWTGSYDMGRYGTTSSTSGWIYSGTADGSGLRSLYCISADSGDDLKPNAFSIPYKTYQATSASRVESSPITISGITAAATVTLVGSQGNPAFKINGVGELTSGSISAGQTLTLVMDAPAGLNQSNKVEVQVGTGAPVPWRVWTGDPNSGISKRIFVTSTTYTGNLGGLAGADLKCQSRADAASLGGTWKALISGDVVDETNWAINRIGFSGNEFKSMAPGSPRISLASALWVSSPLLDSAINYDEFGNAVTSTYYVYTNTSTLGFGVGPACSSWTSPGWAEDDHSGSVALLNSGWISLGKTGSCDNAKRLYCVEQ